MELVLPVALLADVHVARDSIGTLVLSISTCSSLFSPASMLDSSNRWVPGSTGSQGFLTKVMGPSLEFLTQVFIQWPQRIKETHHHTCSMT